MTFDKCELIGHDSKRTQPNLMVVSVAVPETIGGMLEADRWVDEILISPQRPPEKWRVHTLNLVFSPTALPRNQRDINLSFVFELVRFLT